MCFCRFDGGGQSRLNSLIKNRKIKNEKYPQQLKLWILKMVRRADRGGMDGGGTGAGDSSSP